MFARIFLLALVGVAAYPRFAQACSPTVPCRRLGVVLPADGASEVPRNAEVRISYVTPERVDPERARHPVLETDGQEVPATWELAQSNFTALWVGRPTSLLGPSTHYRVRHPYRPCAETDAGASYPNNLCDGSLCDAADGEVIGEFSTATGSDEQVLTAPTVAGPITSAVDICRDTACCGPYARCLFSVKLPTLGDGELYRVTRAGVLQGYVGTSGSPTTVVASVGSTFTWNADLFGAGEFKVSLVDRTGNRSPETAFTIPPCNLAPDALANFDAGVDSGRPETPDASSPRSEDLAKDAATASKAAPELAKHDGCALTQSHWSGAWWVALAFALSARRRVRLKHGRSGGALGVT